MSAKEETHSNDKANSKQKSPESATENLDILDQQQAPSAINLQRAKYDPRSLSPRAVEQLQRTIGNKAVQRLFTKIKPRQAVQPSPFSTSGEPGQQQEEELEKLQMRPLFTAPRASSIARSQSADTPSQAPRLVKTVTLPSQSTIQRFNPMADDPYVPTTDHQHPALVNAGGLAKMGPYKFYPMTGEFKYQPPQIGGGVEHFLKRLLRHKTAGKQYPAEKLAPVVGGYNWKSPKTNANITFHPKGLQPADPAKRVAAATNVYNTEKAGNVIPGKVLDGLKAHNGGKTPRPFASVVTEDGYGAAEKAHTVARHTLGGADAPDADAVAARAAFGMLGGLVGGAVKGAYTPIATAFKTVGDANIDVGAAVAGELTNNWAKYRLDIVTKGGVDLQTVRAGGQVVAYKTTGGGAWPLTEKPAYLVPGAKGQKPLFYPDKRWDAWARPGGILGAAQWLGSWFSARARFSDKQINTLKATPLTTDESAKVNNINVRILASDNPAHMGWFVHSAYPVY